jgi:hypothetical protein
LTLSRSKRAFLCKTVSRLLPCRRARLHAKQLAKFSFPQPKTLSHTTEAIKSLPQDTTTQLLNSPRSTKKLCEDFPRNIFNFRNYFVCAASLRFSPTTIKQSVSSCHSEDRKRSENNSAKESAIRLSSKIVPPVLVLKALLAPFLLLPVHLDAFLA